MIFLVIIIGIIILDQYTKKIALQNLYEGKYYPIFDNKIHLTIHKNKGAALNLFERFPRTIKIITIPPIIGLVLYILKLIKGKGFVLTKLAVGFIIGGGIGNLIDRIKKGHVVDFFISILKDALFSILRIYSSSWERYFYKS
ncbi:MAG: signal peptidase II [Epulopiscium sp.]|nr:signal peptidase II [Candidatus Epulonipiscium sp.]